MKITKQDVISHVVPAIVGIIIGLCLVKCASKPVDNIKIERDTVVVVDTAYYDRPVPKDSVRLKYVTRWLPRDTSSRIDHFREFTQKVEHFADTSKMIAVEVPITSKHYQAAEYDAWVSGFEPSLDSINVYQRTEYITERVTVSKPPNKWELVLVGGINYNFNKKKYTPYAGGELMYKPNRLQIGIRGDIEYTDKVEPVIGGVVKIRLY